MNADLAEHLRARARELGFAACHFTTAAPPTSGARFQAWLAAGYQGEMAWLARTAPKRLDLQQVLPGARSVISLAAVYAGEKRPAQRGESPPAVHPLGRPAPPLPPAPVSLPASPAGFISRYARYTDYHAILAEPLKMLTEWINRQGGAGTRSLWHVDTGPLLERDLAQRAGVGFIGKHTNLVSRRLGNWFFLAEILTTLELPPDAPEKNRCGRCARCLAACPTAALVAPFQLDARRCLSYLTIELRGSIPVELRPALGNRIFGCDDCLAVCPWNRFAGPDHWLAPQARPAWPRRTSSSC